MIAQRSSARSAQKPARRCTPVRGGAHGQLPGGEGAMGKGKSSAAPEIGRKFQNDSAEHLS